MTKEKLEGLMVGHGKLSDRKIGQVLCGQEKTDHDYLFAAATILGGGYAAIWEGHSEVFDNKEDFLASLNIHERSLLPALPNGQ